MCEELHRNKYLGGERRNRENSWTSFDDVNRDVIDCFFRTNKNSVGHSFFSIDQWIIQARDKGTF